jgi:hypothetical protein
MIFGQRFWVWIWVGLLVLGALGLASALYWGRRTHWKNLEEILRAIGTTTVSLGMLLLLQGRTGGVAEVLLIGALASFVLAFVLGRRSEGDRPPPDEDDEETG